MMINGTGTGNRESFDFGFRTGNRESFDSGFKAGFLNGRSYGNQEATFNMNQQYSLMDKLAEAVINAAIQGVAGAVGNLAMQLTPYVLANATVYSLKATQFVYENTTAAIEYCYSTACDTYENYYSKPAELPGAGSNLLLGMDTAEVTQ